MAQAKVRLKGTPSGHDGNGYITVNGRVVPAFWFTKLALNAEMIVDERRFLETRTTQHAPRGINISGSVTYMNCTSAFIKAVADFKDGGEYPDITVQGYAQVSGRGRCEILATDVILKNIGLLSLDDGNNSAVSFDSDITADDFQIIESFKEV